MSIQAPQEYVDLAHQLADIARPIAKQHFRQPLEIIDKPDESPVTIADRSIETAIREHLQAIAPDHGVFGEEYGKQGIDRDWVWVIDPIDGTQAFITGVPLFGILIALCHKGEPVYGIIDQPHQEERWQGGPGYPAMYNGQPVKTRSCSRLADVYQFTTAPGMFKAPGDIAAFKRLSDQVKAVRFGADCYAAGLIASGHADLMVEASLSPYDYMALVAVIEAAGGQVTDWNGARLSFDSDGRMLAAACPEIHTQALAVLRD